MSRRYRFDRAYYERFCGYPRVRVSDTREVAVLGDFVCAYLRYLGQAVRSVLDVGCGLGLWKDVVGRHYPKARYTGLEISGFLCERYGWTHGSVVDFEARAAFDLVVCSDVLQYLSDREASAAIDNLAQLCGGALYFNLLTAEDWEENCDRERTNGDVYLRRSDWYRRRLRRHFIQAGGGLFVSREASIILWELEKLE
ncbi:MAG: class I SAM-dependent methyltransferase [Myxococcota bacterium]|nr:class I SAM-dependent methyltransferase [Myxococcota bacterium]